MRHVLQRTDFWGASVHGAVHRAGVAAALATMGLLLSGCASLPGVTGSSQSPLYRCENNIEFTARFVDDSALLDSTRGYEVLYRDAGGLTEKQPVYSNSKMKAEFGLGASGREASLRYPLLPLVARCVRD